MTTSAAPITRTTDETAIANLVTQMEEGWNAQDGKLFAAPFATAHDYVVVNGIFFPNWSPAANSQVHEHLWHEGAYREGSQIKTEIVKTRWLRPDLALVHMRSMNTFRRNGEAQQMTALISLVIDKIDGEWAIVSFQNTAVQSQF